MEKIQSMCPDGTSLDQLWEMKLDFSNVNVMKAMLESMRDVCDIKVPFNKFIGIKIDSININKLDVRIEMKEEMIGNFQRNILHGGVISTVIDLTGGLIVQASILKQMKDNSLMEIVQRFTKSKHYKSEC
jgi:acyl-coenzyme A thioesterase PaaI-like protein